ncbi:MAG: bile acid:sodium symporter family protein [Saprospiraceae bacterium]|jgi:bile acid:Na+ symporter, BASS family|nr:bile acid:sodium symporter family protein [Saprospiraceae bacterium]MDP4997531.1 bile acid:sodium symporter family protein [Saprospiraceae bacterium]
MESSILTEIFLPLALAVIMLGMGLSLTLDDFRRITVAPKPVLIGLVNQLILLPIVAYILIIVFNIQTELAVGFMILAACPGGATSNLISHLAKGDTALSITLTAISSLVTVVSIPFIVNFGIIQFMPNGSAMQLNVFGTVIAVVVITIIPVSIGMLIHKLAPAFSQRMERPVRILSAVFLALIILAAILKERAHILEFFQQAGPVALLLNLLTLGIGFYTSRLFRLPQDQSRTIAIESGIQNGTLGITIAATLIGNSAMTIPSVIYSLIMFGTVLVLVFRSNAKV